MIARPHHLASLLSFIASLAIAAAGCGGGSGHGGGGDDDDDGQSDGGGPGGDPDGGPGSADASGPDADVIPPVTVCATGGDYDAIQPAIDAAEVGQTVRVCPGTYREHLVIAKAIRVVGVEGSDDTILDAEGTDRGVVISDVDAPGVTVRGLTIRRGYSPSWGGGIRCNSSTLTLDDVVLADGVADTGAGLSAQQCALAITASHFTGNATEESGGGLFLDGSSGAISGSVIASNSAHRGGGIFQNEGSVAITSDDIHDNQAEDGGGGIYNDSDAPVTACRIADNQAGIRGGGLSMINHAATASNNTVTGNRSGDDGAGVFVFISTATVTDNDIHDNHAQGDAGGLRVLGSEATIIGNHIHDNTAVMDGGGLKISHDMSVVHDNVLDGNTADGNGGGIELDDDHSTLSRLTIVGNRAYGGGGLHCNEVLVDFRVENTLIANNTATGSGGAVRYDGVTETGTFSFVTMVNNASPGVGGADFVGGKAAVENSIIAGNAGTQVRFSGAELKGWAYTDVSPATFSGMSDPTGASGNISQSPGFVDSIGKNYHLKASSACRNAGDPAIEDPDGSRADMGAYGGPKAM